MSTAKAKEAENPKPKSRVNWGGADSSGSSSDEIGYYRGRSYCCGLIHTGDSLCFNFIKLFCLFVVLPLLIYWLWRSGYEEKILEKVGEVAEQVIEYVVEKCDCKCCRELCKILTDKLNVRCIQQCFNNCFCRHCCGLQSGCERCFSCLGEMCRLSCFKDICSFLAICLTKQGIGQCFGRCCACLGAGCQPASCSLCLRSLFLCNCDQMECCDLDKGCDNVFQCCGKCPCCRTCEKFDRCVCCPRRPGRVNVGRRSLLGNTGGGSGTGGDVGSGGGGSGDCCDGCSERVCNCCYQPSRERMTESRHPRYQKYSRSYTYRNRGRYAPKRKKTSLS